MLVAENVLGGQGILWQELEISGMF